MGKAKISGADIFPILENLVGNQFEEFDQVCIYSCVIILIGVDY